MELYGGGSGGTLSGRIAIPFEDPAQVYRGSYNVQRGGGIGNFLGGLFRFVRPLFMSTAKRVGKEILNTGGVILQDIAGKHPDEPVSDIIKRRVKEALVKNKMSGGGGARSLSRSKIGGPMRLHGQSLLAIRDGKVKKRRKKVAKRVKKKQHKNKKKKKRKASSKNKRGAAGSRTKRDLFDTNHLF